MPYKNAGALSNLDPVIFSLLPKRQISSRYSLQKEFTRTAMEEQLPSEKSNPNRNPNKVSNSANAKKNKKSEFEFCKVCNRNHDEGQRHKYFPSHTKSLSKFLSRVQSKITEIRFFLKDPAILRNEHAFRNRFWCVFCDCDIDELGSYFACNNAINHLASVDHLKNLKHFLWKYGSGMDRMDAFRISETDLARWEKKCKSLETGAVPSCEGSRGALFGPSNNIHNELSFENMNNFENNNVQPLYSNISNGVIPLQFHTNEYQVSHSGLSEVANIGSHLHAVTSLMHGDASSGSILGNLNGMTGTNRSGNIYLGREEVSEDERVINRVINSQGLQNITQISSMAPQEAAGNVHSGAPPPWLDATEGDQLKQVLSGFVPSNKSGKSKLNPKRVGAAWAEKRKMEMEIEKRGEIAKSEFDSNWLPNFGRVWQSGSRKESRKEFEIERKKQPKAQNHTEMSMKIQPYISKRMRRDANEDCGGNPRVNE
ncbi:TITAN-like protein isoform X2 [Mangifera indica]|uniref:TITAN-like protein isoform X2 n=1 Tax=Mangifera indica TaxID=29780 RepID=UPI001CFBFFC1|nr:TITAN-like protein isoform X2 [Mangifera indica]